MKERKIAIVLAAGQGKRMQSAIQKQYLLLKDKPILYYSLKAFQDSDIIDEVIVVVGEGEKEYVQINFVEKYQFHKVRKIILGGKERYHSVYQGILAIEANTMEKSYCFIHDGARPFITESIIERAYNIVREEQACVVGMPVKDTIKLLDEEGYVLETPNRNIVWMMQTPQVFSLDVIKACYKKLINAEKMGEIVSVTDDASVVELYSNIKVKMVEGSYENIKITTPEDLKIGSAFLE